jgi:hypothetical protein
VDRATASVAVSGMQPPTRCLRAYPIGPDTFGAGRPAVTDFSLWWVRTAMGEHDARSDAVDPDPERTSSLLRRPRVCPASPLIRSRPGMNVLAQRLHAGDGHRTTAAAAHGVAGVLTVPS